MSRDLVAALSIICATLLVHALINSQDTRNGSYLGERNVPQVAKGDATSSKGIIQELLDKLPSFDG